MLLLCVYGACRAEPPFGTSMAGGCEKQQSAERPPPAFLFWAGRKWVIFKAGAQVWNRISCFSVCKKGEMGYGTGCHPHALCQECSPCASKQLGAEAFCCWVLSRPQPC